MLARLDGQAGGPSNHEAGRAAELVAVRYIPAGLLIHRPRAEAFQADIDRLTGLAVPEVVPFRHYEHAPKFAAAYDRWGGAVGGALVSDAVEGVPLSHVLERHGALPAPAALLVFRRTLRALAAAHDRGLVHGDLRLAKVLVRADGATTVTGLGLAALTSGAPALRAPELWRGEATASPAGDVYAAACMLHLCLTGEPPFPVTQLFSLMAQHATAPVPVTAAPRMLHAPLAAGLAKDPARRPAPEILMTELAWKAKRALGGDWEERGRSVLRTLAEPLVTALPRTPSSTVGSRPLEGMPIM
ncbi:protein kinase domain-containing protein [Streptomyces triticiradicis]|uniref:protein kinase domain-containing protein n=1 Tax=Streptomyces triticiradicis TaxID=2651189 RepID=UPI001788CD68|nr:hypothetical protein [Streptomyces triticiradicis]